MLCATYMNIDRIVTNDFGLAGFSLQQSSAEQRQTMHAIQCALVKHFGITLFVFNWNVTIYETYCLIATCMLV